MAYGILLSGLDLILQRWLPFVRESGAGLDFSWLREWRARIVMSVAIALWLLTWLGGWWVSRLISSGSFVWTMAGSCVGWLIGLAVAVVVFYLDEQA